MKINSFGVRTNDLGHFIIARVWSGDTNYVMRTPQPYSILIHLEWWVRRELAKS